MNKKITAAIAATLATVAVAGPASAAVVASQNFDSGTGDWVENGATISNDAGTLRVIGAGGGDGTYSYFGGIAGSTGTERTTALGDGYIAALQVYLDPAAVAPGEGFDLTVAASKVADGSHLRDFIFHVAKDISSDALLVGASNNSNFNVREDIDTINHATITTAGWYTLQHSFYANESGALAVDLNLLDAKGEVLWTETRSTPADIATIVGGARYQWLTVVDGSFRFDNQSLERVDPKPVLTTKSQCGDDAWKSFGFKNQGQCVASLTANVNSGK